MDRNRAVMLISADYIYTPEGWLDHHLLETDEQGTIKELRMISPDDQPQHFNGLLCPGWVNVHCHLELSALKGHIPVGTGMTGFISEIFSKRNAFTDKEKRLAVEKAMYSLIKTGTVALGDICNSTISLRPKKEISGLFTHSFIELLGLDVLSAQKIFSEGLELADSFEDLSHSITPHAPYSVSTSLLREIYSLPAQLRSIHLMESLEERKLFEEDDGPFRRFFEKFNLPYQAFAVKSPWQYVSADLSVNEDVIWVHCADMRPDELAELAEKFPDSMFCLCPRSNHYIHKRLPEIRHFLPFEDRICLGTDSLASNHSLDLFDEIKLLQKEFPEISLHRMIKWGSTQGAMALRQSNKFGIFAAGFRPGINLITEIDHTHMRLSEKSRVEKLF